MYDIKANVGLITVQLIETDQKSRLCYVNETGSTQMVKPRGSHMKSTDTKEFEGTRNRGRPIEV